MVQCYKTGRGTPNETGIPDVEDIMESLESPLPETPSWELSVLTPSVTNASSSSRLFNTLIYSSTNNFAGLRGVTRRSLMRLLREHDDIRTQLFEVIKGGKPGVARPLTENLFRAAVEGCVADAVATIIHHTKSDPNIAIDPNEIACNHEGRDYTPLCSSWLRSSEM